MKKFFEIYFWTILIAVSAIGLAGSAAYFSISGLSKLFAGSSMQVIIMASFLEFAKIATTAVLHRFWKYIKWSLKIPLTFMVVVIMAITSSGIYGFLAEAYTTTSNQMQKIEGQIVLIEKQKEQKKEQILSIDEIKKSKSNRVTTLIDLRVQQEARIDTLYSKRMNTAAKQAQLLIEQSNKEINLTQKEIDSLTTRIQIINTEIGELDITILDLQNTDVAAELGPLKYMSSITGKPMESVINWFIMAIMLAFDPLAVLLVVLANNVYDGSKRRRNSIVESELIDGDELEQVKAKEGESEENLNDNQKRIIDTVNNSNQNEIDSSYDFIPEEKSEEVVEYIEGDGGKFEKNNNKKESLSSLVKGIDSNPLYLLLLEVFYLSGERKAGEVIPPYDTFLRDIKDKRIECDEKVVKNFLTIANLLGIVNMADKNNVTLMKDYESAKQIISLVSK